MKNEEYTRRCIRLLNFSLLTSPIDDFCKRKVTIEKEEFTRCVQRLVSV